MFSRKSIGKKIAAYHEAKDVTRMELAFHFQLLMP